MGHLSTASHHVNQQTKSARLRQSKAEILDALAKVVEQRDASNSKLAEMAAELVEAKARLATALTDAQALDAVRPCSPGGQPAVEAVMPTEEGVLFIWVTMADAAYKVRFGGQTMEGKKFVLVKFQDGSKRTVTETDSGELVCDCIHHTQRGQHAKPCRHKRAIKAVKQLFATCGPKMSTTPPAGASQVEQPPIKRLSMAQILEDSADQFAGCQPAA